MSYPRHEYFRRVLCNLVGRDVERGDLPDDEVLLGPFIRNICSRNAQQYLALPETAPRRRLPEVASRPVLPVAQRPAGALPIMAQRHPGRVLKRD
jgi:hypothetical protein